MKATDRATLTEAQLSAIEDAANRCDWTCNFYFGTEQDVFFEFETYSVYGGDYIACIWGNELQEVKNALFDYYWDFDPEEYAVSWYGANRGEPKSLRALLEDADDIDRKLKNLFCAVSKVEL